MMAMELFVHLATLSNLQKIRPEIRVLLRATPIVRPVLLIVPVSKVGEVDAVFEDGSVS
jgi:hypothetical protein